MACRQTSLSFGCKLYRNVLVMVAYHRSYHLPFSTVWSSSSRSLSLSLFFFWGREGERSSYIRMSFGGCLGIFIFILLDDLVLTAFYQDGLWSKRSFTDYFFIREFFYMGVLDQLLA